VYFASKRVCGGKLKCAEVQLKVYYRINVEVFQEIAEFAQLAAHRTIYFFCHIPTAGKHINAYRIARRPSRIRSADDAGSAFFKGMTNKSNLHWIAFKQCLTVLDAGTKQGNHTQS
jgi:hypothetical protein